MNRLCAGWVLGCMALTATAASHPPRPSSLAALDTCIATLDSLDLGYERIAERCPTLAPSLEASPYAPWLPADWKRPGNELSKAGLQQLRLLLARAGQRVPPHRAAVEPLTRVLAQLPAPSAPARLQPPPPQPLGLHTWLDWTGLSELTLPARLTPAVLLLVMVLAVALLWREGALAGLPFGRGRRRGRPSTAVPASPATAAPGPLLEALLARLREQGRLPAPHSLTARELTEAVRLPPPEHARFTHLAHTAETLTFAREPPPGAQIAAAVEEGRQLLAHLSPPHP